MQPDVIEQLGASTIQHGAYNNRIYLMNAAAEDVPSLPRRLKAMAEHRGYTKIFAKVAAVHALVFLDEGFEREAQIPRFFNGEQPALMLGCFLDDARKESHTAVINERVMAACREKTREHVTPQKPEDAELRVCTPAGADAMAELYGRVFQTYPFPIHEADFLRRMMASHVVYFGVWTGGDLAALSSAEIDAEARSAEMTDFATDPAHRGQGLAAVLLDAMEQDMRSRDIATAYTIARAPSYGMNITFARMGYEFGGRLINNTNIGGQFEDMNVWHKGLAPRR